MFTPHNPVGMIVLKAPPIPKIDHEVPLLPELKDDEESVGSAKHGVAAVAGG